MHFPSLLCVLTSVNLFQTIFNEIDDLFHSPFIAIGGDEVDFAALQVWTDHVNCFEGQKMNFSTGTALC